MNITDLPDFPALQQIQGALWGSGDTRGAAVMVGAGFSRNADLAADNAKPPPLWTEFCEAMGERLYPNQEVPRDPLRLAEEYRAVMGLPALEGLIFDLIRDDEWRPGTLHRKLISLPWADILTTNWDTLLERAAAITTSRTYETVRAVADIPRTRAPRIVKLHGSMPSNRPFIFTEEDYRTYPVVFAPFVNLVQQVLLENELCLLGFSGDDPNFLHWSGWVRDQLGASGRRIYLIGLLNLSPARRKFLEARNVSPVDLAPLVNTVDKSEKHHAATEALLDYLISCKPQPAHEWLLTSSEVGSEWAKKTFEERRDPVNGARYLKEMAVLWKKERESYPGWLVCPLWKRHEVRRNTDLGFRFGDAISKLPEPERGGVVYEVAWRFDVSFWPLPPWLTDVFAQTAQNGGALGLSKQQRCHLGLILLRTAKEGHNLGTFEQWGAFVRNEAGADRDILAALLYEQCLWARDDLDFAKLAAFLKSLIGSDPAWKIRRAALYSELGDVERATTDIEDALKDIRDRCARDRKSIWVVSRLAWATYLARAIRWLDQSQGPSGWTAEPDEWPTKFHEIKSDPWDELHDIDRQMVEAFRQKAQDAITRELRFDPGVYRDLTGTTRFTSSSVVSPAYEMARLADAVGLPAILNHTDIARTRLRRAVELLDDRSEEGTTKCIRTLSGHTDELIGKYFGRISVARMPFDAVGRLIDRLWQTIDFGSARLKQQDKDANECYNTYWVERLRTNLELLSRLVVRLPSPKAEAVFRRGIAISNDPRWDHWWLFESLGNLLERSIFSISPSDRHNLLMDVLNFPLPDERAISGMDRDWPELIEQIREREIVRPANDIAFRHRVAQLIAKVQLPGPARGRPALRLTLLYEAGALNVDEAKQFGEALWSQREAQTGLPADTNLLPHVFLKIPAPDPHLALSLFRSKILVPAVSGQITPENMLALMGACVIPEKATPDMEITAAEAKALIDPVLNWQPTKVDMDLGEIRSRNRETAKTIGPLLADVVLPHLDVSALSKEQIDKVFSVIDAGIAPSVIVALPELVRLEASRSSEAINVIHRSLLSSEGDVVYYACDALRRWRLGSQGGRFQQCPVELWQVLIAIVTTRREPGLLHALQVLQDFVRGNVLSKDDQLRVADALNTLRTETAYEIWNDTDPRTSTVTLVRAQCVRLAKRLEEAGLVHTSIGAWAGDTNSDPMPEVRHAQYEG